MAAQRQQQPELTMASAQEFVTQWLATHPVNNPVTTADDVAQTLEQLGYSRHIPHAQWIADQLNHKPKTLSVGLVNEEKDMVPTDTVPVFQVHFFVMDNVNNSVGDCMLESKESITCLPCSNIKVERNTIVNLTRSSLDVQQQWKCVNPAKVTEEDVNRLKALWMERLNTRQDGCSVESSYKPEIVHFYRDKDQIFN